MNLDDALVELRRTLSGWGLSSADWALILHFADKLQGYDMRYERDEHLHIIVSSDDIPWGNSTNVENDEIEIPNQLPYSHDFRG
ncbi:MAG: hypothetical protein JXC85_06350 [Candidatus Aenigmarchaeota archaeon]|nr:hypothetical protein [Candidatus Aenigmarchaeota archaeon]